MTCTNLLSTPLTCMTCGAIETPALFDVGVTVPDLERNGGVLRPVVGLCIGEPVICRREQNALQTLSIVGLLIVALLRIITENCRRMTGGVVAGFVGSR